jgi:DNA polymerase/3'-5' exonuclease PolX
MIYKDAIKLATQAVNELAPYCDRIAIAGSVRRQSVLCNDIEIVCTPKGVRAVYGQDVQLFGDTVITVNHSATPKEFIEVVNRLQKSKGEASGRYTQRLLPGGIKLDLFICTPDNWGTYSQSAPAAQTLVNGLFAV